MTPIFLSNTVLYLNHKEICKEGNDKKEEEEEKSKKETKGYNKKK